MYHVTTRVRVLSLILFILLKINNNAFTFVLNIFYCIYRGFGTQVLTTSIIYYKSTMVIKYEVSRTRKKRGKYEEQNIMKVRTIVQSYF